MPREKIEITVERVRHNGHLKLSTIYKGYLRHQMYIGYSKREAIQLFRQYVKETS